MDKERGTSSLEPCGESYVCSVDAFDCLNDVCDSLRHHAAKLGAIRGAFAPSRNALSYGEQTSQQDMMEELFWTVLGHLQAQPKFGLTGRYSGLPRRFKRAVHAVDSSTIALVANCMDWAKHRRRKAAAKLHLRLNLQSFLPSFAIIEEASHLDDTRAPALCEGLQAGSRSSTRLTSTLPICST